MGDSTGHVVGAMVGAPLVAPCIDRQAALLEDGNGVLIGMLMAIVKITRLEDRMGGILIPAAAHRYPADTLEMPR